MVQALCGGAEIGYMKNADFIFYYMYSPLYNALFTHNVKSQHKGDFLLQNLHLFSERNKFDKNVCDTYAIYTVRPA